MKQWVESDDGSYTAYSSEYDEHYHSTKDGALNESLKKHIEPAFTLLREKDHIRLIDICFGLGFNTLLSLYYRDTYYPDTTLEIYSPELDGDLVASLVDFPYPEIFEPYRNIITDLATLGGYEDERTQITVEIIDARKGVGELEGIWDVWYQDAFSPAVNPILWTREFFADAARLLGEEGVLTTYSTALATRLALYENGFGVYLNRGEGYRNATIASRRNLEDIEKVDMEHKIACNPQALPLMDEIQEL
ncbi:MAG: MnmC family methyltransferase [Sulfuricurvum sp.]|jgi:tRNA U34 5-methylaminomethyl-2-thiouridine-forming methyltransferase MnmC|uniref:tRNA (5-methylaminomethyl-2-thiouridine)(34)-methyltransferase MnmD n=1 Tax=Sulfuricurvum sp. TaxID=2025608 RepID=UPI0025CBB971|nr:MnmC family methyltransferase [Sulfuricurvum sp.]MCK9374203.1 MnmC family methyltransferase [Sulfuricurvum sp.]